MKNWEKTNIRATINIFENQDDVAPTITKEMGGIHSIVISGESPYSTIDTIDDGFNNGVVKEPHAYNIDINIYANSNDANLLRSCRAYKCKCSIVIRPENLVNSEWSQISETLSEVRILSESREYDGGLPLISFNAIGLRYKFQNADYVLSTFGSFLGENSDDNFGATTSTFFEEWRRTST